MCGNQLVLGHMVKGRIPGLLEVKGAQDPTYFRRHYTGMLFSQVQKRVDMKVLGKTLEINMRLQQQS